MGSYIYIRRDSAINIFDLKKAAPTGWVIYEALITITYLTLEVTNANFQSVHCFELFT